MTIEALRTIALQPLAFRPSLGMDRAFHFTLGLNDVIITMARLLLMKTGQTSCK
jgi:hypothetical protein